MPTRSRSAPLAPPVLEGGGEGGLGIGALRAAPPPTRPPRPACPSRAQGHELQQRVRDLEAAEKAAQEKASLSFGVLGLGFGVQGLGLGF